jgi:hypothetical protein
MSCLLHCSNILNDANIFQGRYTFASQFRQHSLGSKRNQECEGCTARLRAVMGLVAQRPELLGVDGFLPVAYMIPPL